MCWWTPIAWDDGNPQDAHEIFFIWQPDCDWLIQILVGDWFINFTGFCVSCNALWARHNQWKFPPFFKGHWQSISWHCPNSNKMYAVWAVQGDCESVYEPKVQSRHQRDTSIYQDRVIAIVVCDISSRGFQESCEAECPINQKPFWPALGGGDSVQLPGLCIAP